MIGEGTIHAIIPARGGSKGIPGKNVRELAGYPLIAYSIAAAKLCSTIQRVLVSTDSEEIAEVSRQYGAEVPFMRPSELAGDLSPDREFVIHALEWLEANEGIIPEHLVHLRPTTPLRDPALIDVAVGKIMSRPEATSLRSGHEAPESPYKWFTRDEDGYFCGFCPDDPRPGYANLPRQLFPAVYIPDGYVDVLRTSFVLGSDEIHGERLLGFVSPACIEVDNPEAFEMLEFQLKREQSSIVDYLKTNFPLEA